MFVILFSCSSLRQSFWTTAYFENLIRPRYAAYWAGPISYFKFPGTQSAECFEIVPLSTLSPLFGIAITNNKVQYCGADSNNNKKEQNGAPYLGK